MFSALFVRSVGSNHQAIPCRFDNLFGNRFQIVELEDALDLTEEALQQTEIPCRDLHNSRNGFLIGKIG